MAANYDPQDQQHVAIMGEPIESPDNTTQDVIRLVICDIVTNMMPRHALQCVRRYLSRQCIKPQNMDVRTYYQRLRYINAKELPWIPPFKVGQDFSDNRIKEMLLFATPPECQREMDQMGFDPSTQDSLAVLHFTENVEVAETSIPAKPEAHSLLSRFSALTHGNGQRNTNP